MGEAGPSTLQGSGWSLGIDEVSGLGARWDPWGARAELLAVGDETTRLCLGAWVDGELALTTEKVARVPRHLGSDWEGVAGDGTGRVLILQEKGSRLLVVSADLRLEGHARLRHEWEDDDRGLESMVLLTNGHLLVAKQRRPVTILELAPSGEEPFGTARGPLHGAEAFQAPAAGTELVTAASWEVEDDDVGSLNDLTLPLDGPLLGVSSRSRSVVELTDLEAGRPAVSVRRRWALPDDVVDADSRAEGLLVDARLGAFVALDSHGTAPSLYAWEPL